MTVALRPYQTEGVARARLLARRGHKRILLVAATGSGKTVIAASVISSSHAKGKRVVFFAHRQELINQTMNKLIDAGVPREDIGVMMGSDARADESARVQVVSIQTWARRKDLPKAELCFIDESHTALSATYKRAIAHYVASGAVVLGLTATPYRANGDGLGECFDVLEVMAQPSTLVAEGFILDPAIYAGKERADLSNVRMSGGDYAQDALGAAMDKPELVGGVVDNWLRLADGRRTICFAATVEHSRSIVASFVDAGVRAEHLDAETPKEERAGILQRLRDGSTLVVSNVGVLCEGTDIPAAKCCILARPTKSCGLFLQQVGRVLRPWQNETALVLDHAQNAQRHGWPTADREFTLEKRKRRGTGEAPTKECEMCHMVCAVAARVCPGCGAEFPVKPTERVEARGSDQLEKLARAEQKDARWAGAPSSAQLKTLSRYGLQATSFGEAQSLIGQIARNQWRCPAKLKPQVAST